MAKSGFLLYPNYKEIFDNLGDEEAGQLIKIIFEYEDLINLDKPKKLEIDDRLKNDKVKLAFIIIRQELDKNRLSYDRRCETSKDNGKLGGRPSKNSPNKNLKKPTKADIDIDIDIKENIKRKKYGLYQRVVLTDDQYSKLIKDFGQAFIDKQIQSLDEAVETTNNKNKYSNFNLVLRRAIREKWYKIPMPKQEARVFN